MLQGRVEAGGGGGRGERGSAGELGRHEMLLEYVPSETHQAAQCTTR